MTESDGQGDDSKAATGGAAKAAAPEAPALVIIEAFGGIRPMALMEDFDFVRRMERHGETVCIAAPPATTSSRRFHGRPAWRIVGQWLLIHALYYIRTPPEALAWLYRWRRHAPGERSGA
jgi:hypothetical protein